MTLGQKQSHIVAYASLSPIEVEATLPIIESIVEDRQAFDDDYSSDRVEGEALVGVLVASTLMHKDLELIGPDAEEVARLVFNGLHNLITSSAAPDTQDNHPHVLAAA